MFAALVGLLAGYLTSRYLRDRSALTVLRAAKLRYKLRFKLSISPSNIILTSGQPVSVLILKRQTPGRVAT